RLCGAPNSPEAGGISASVGGNSIRFRTQCERASAPHPASRLWLLRCFLLGRRQGKRIPDLQQLGLALASARWRQNKRLAAVRERPRLAISESRRDCPCLGTVPLRARSG